MMHSSISLIREWVRLVLKEDEDGEAGRPRKRPGTDLAKFVDKGGGSKELAKKLGIEQQHVDKLARDEAKPSLELAFDIEKETQGQVPVEHWIDVDPDSNARKKD